MFGFFEAISRIPAPFNMVVWVVFFGCGSAVIGSIATEIRKYACHRQELALKREMIERGFEPNEIERVMRTDTRSRA